MTINDMNKSFDHVVLCYRGNSLIYRIELTLNNMEFEKQLRNKELIYQGERGTEIIYLNNFDKVVIVL